MNGLDRNTLNFKYANISIYVKMDYKAGGILLD